MRRDPADFRRAMTSWALDLANVVRRVVFTATTGGRWGIEGYETGDDLEGAGDDAGDDDLVDVFQGLYVYARPGADDKPEGLMLHVGAEAEHPTVAALRNEDARRRYVDEFGDLARGEIAIFNSAGKTRIFIQADGEVQVEAEAGKEIKLRSPGGAVSRLVTEADFLGHGHATAGTGAPSGPIGVAPTPPAPFTFTSVLKAE